MDGLHHAAACQQSSENRHDKGKDDQHHIPDLQHAFLFLDHDGMQKRGSNQPGHHRGVLNRIPCPEAAPTQFVVCPFTAEHDSDAQKHPRDHRPAARRTNPCIGIMLGGKWAYHELGWGGFWAWDPVENASMMPWLIGTAFLHS